MKARLPVGCITNKSAAMRQQEEYTRVALEQAREMMAQESGDLYMRVMNMVFYAMKQLGYKKRSVERIKTYMEDKVMPMWKHYAKCQIHYKGQDVENGAGDDMMLSKLADWVYYEPDTRM